MFPKDLCSFTALFPVVMADVDVNATIISICNWVIGLGLALGMVGFVGVGLMFMFAFDDSHQSAKARRALVMVVFGMIILFSASGLAAVVKDHIVQQAAK